MLKHYVIFLVALISFIPQNFSDYIYWHKRRMLEWTDFKVKTSVSASEERRAVTQSEFYTKTKTEGTKLFITVESEFNKNLSWVTKTGQDDYTLAHEQGHFDITEVNARKYRYAISKFTFKRNSYHHDLDSLCAIYNDMNIKEQAQYDLETNHALNKAIQEQWIERIMGELNHEYRYTDPEIVTTFSN